jgi:hypothetical protein
LIFSIKALGKLLVEPKTLGWEHSCENFENVFKNLGVVSTPLNFFKNGFWSNGVGQGGKRSWWFYKEKALVVLCSRSEQLTRATTLPQYGTGPSLKFICLSAGSFALYKVL